MNNYTSLIDPIRRIGTVTLVTATAVELTLPKALAASGRRGLAQGTVGDFVFIDCDREAALGRITQVGIPDKQMSAVEYQIEKEALVEPYGQIRLLATISKTTGKVSRGISVQPRLGDGVYLADAATLSNSIKDALRGNIQRNGELLMVQLGRLSGAEDAEISIPPEKLFGRHCGIFGATGGGKSWTLSKLLNEIVRLEGKCILFDPTGEFIGKIQNSQEFAFGNISEGDPELVHFPTQKLAEIDLYALLTPNGQSQGPILRAAIASLRLAKAILNNTEKFPRTIDENGDTIVNVTFRGRNVGDIIIEERGTILKENKSRRAYNCAEVELAREMSSDLCDFDISILSFQIRNECLDISRDKSKFGSTSTNLLGYCNSLVVRLETHLKSSELSCIFRNDGEDFCCVVDEFFNNREKKSLVFSFERVSFKNSARELLLNTIGRHLLTLARERKFIQNPLVCALDEAHQFLNRSLGDDQNRVQLDAFGIIAKEGRKYGLTTLIATQRPRDVPQDVLSQVGTLFVHRLTNERDRETVEKACGDLDRSAAAFIPSLSQGEVIVVGPDLPVPLPILMAKPEKGQQPGSHGPRYQDFWGNDISLV